MNALGVLLPLHVHLIDVVGGVAGQEVVVGVRGRVGCARIMTLAGQGQGATSRGELPRRGSRRDRREARRGRGFRGLEHPSASSTHGASQHGGGWG